MNLCEKILFLFFHWSLSLWGTSSEGVYPTLARVLMAAPVVCAKFFGKDLPRVALGKASLEAIGRRRWGSGPVKSSITIPLDLAKGSYLDDSFFNRFLSESPTPLLGLFNLAKVALLTQYQKKGLTPKKYAKWQALSEKLLPDSSLLTLRSSGTPKWLSSYN